MKVRDSGAARVKKCPYAKVVGIPTQFDLQNKQGRIQNEPVLIQQETNLESALTKTSVKKAIAAALVLYLYFSTLSSS